MLNFGRDYYFFEVCTPQSPTIFLFFFFRFTINPHTFLNHWKFQHTQCLTSDMVWSCEFSFMAKLLNSFVWYIFNIWFSLICMWWCEENIYTKKNILYVLRKYLKKSSSISMLWMVYVEKWKLWKIISSKGINWLLSCHSRYVRDCVLQIRKFHPLCFYILCLNV